MPISTTRLVLRRFRSDDAAALAAYRSDPAVARYQGWSAPVSAQDAAALVREFGLGNARAPGWFQYAVELTATRTLIGDVGVNMHENLMQAEIGYTLAAEYHGHGYATEAVGRILELLFNERGVHRVAAECDARNLSSARLLSRLGFRREGHRIAGTWIKGEWTDDLLFGLLAEEWRPVAVPSSDPV